jgi:DNA gyrase subunit A
MDRDGYRKTNRGTKGVRTMALSDADSIVGVRQIPDLSDQLFMLTEKGMMIRMPATQTKETLGKVTKGTRIMELRDAKKKSHIDEVIFVARLPAELIDGDDEDSEGIAEEE